MDKIKANPEQMAALESIMVAYMVTVENKIGLDGDLVKKTLMNLDKTWDSMFEVSIKQ